MEFYHGTTLTSARGILEKGFRQFSFCSDFSVVKIGFLMSSKGHPQNQYAYLLYL